MNTKTPLYPRFAKLSKDHAGVLRDFVGGFPPYSDYSFASLYSWNSDGKTALSFLHGNLVIKMKDYVEDKVIYTFLGENRVEDVADLLLRETDSLKLVPEVVACRFKSLRRFRVQEDESNHDYILNLAGLASYSGSLYKDKRYGNKRGRKLYKRIVFEKSALDDSLSKSINALLNVWAKVKEEHRSDYEDLGLADLRAAINRALELAGLEFVGAMRLVIDGRFAGFMVYENLGQGYVAGHYINGDTLHFPYVYEILYNEIGRHFSALGFTFLNIEQDLGVPYLKKSKTKWGPDHFLKKYLLTRS